VVGDLVSRVDGQSGLSDAAHPCDGCHADTPGRDQVLGQLLQLADPAGEVAAGERQLPGRRRYRRLRPLLLGAGLAAAGGGSGQCRPLVRVQVEGIGQGLHGAGLWIPAGAALEGADRLHAHPGPDGQVVLGQAGRRPVPAEQGRELRIHSRYLR
jgi:hypothetical protein